MKYLFTIISILCISVSLHAEKNTKKTIDQTEVSNEEAEKIGLTFSVDYFSNYYYRGLNRFNNDGVFSPSIVFEKYGFEASLSGDLSEDNIIDDGSLFARDRNSADGRLNYSYSFNDGNKKLVTLGAGVMNYYFFYDTSYNYCTGNAFVRLDMFPFNPELSYSHDYYFDKEAVLNQAKDFYIKIALSHNIKIIDKGWIDLGLSCGYYNMESTEIKNGVSDIEASIKMVVETQSGIIIKGGFCYIVVPSADFKSGSTDYNGDGSPDVDMHRFYSSFGVAYKL